MAGSIDILKLQKAKGITYSYTNIDKIVDGSFVKKLREKNEYTQTRLSILLGVTKKTIEKWEQGKNKIKGSAAILVYLLYENPDLSNLLIRKEESVDVEYIKTSVENKFSSIASYPSLEREEKPSKVSKHNLLSAC